MLIQLILKAKELLGFMGVRQEKGQGLIEYALIILLISIVVIVVLGLLGTEVNNVFQQIVDAFTP